MDVWFGLRAGTTCREAINAQRYVGTLADFAKLVEQFDSNGVTFVSVTQQFNTTTSMGRLTGNGQIQHREFAMASGEMSEAEFVSFLTNAIDLTARFTAPNAIAYALLSGGDETDTAQTSTAKAEFLRRKAKIDETRNKKFRPSISLQFQRLVSPVGRESPRPDLFISIYLSRWARLFGLSCSSDHPA